MKKLLSLSTAVSLLIPFALTAAPAAKDANAKKPAAAVTAAKPAAAKPAAKPAAVKPAAAKPVAAKTAAKPAKKKAEVKAAEKQTAAKPAEDKKFAVPAPAPADPASTTNESVELPAKPAPRPVKYRKNVPIKFVMITSNYPTARFLADKSREKADCTIIIVPEELPFPERGTLLTVIPARADDAFSIRAEHLSRFLAYLRPLNVILLGNEKVLPPFYRPAVPSFCNVIRVADTAWHVNAQTLDNVFNTDQALYKSYSRYNYQRNLKREQEKENEAQRAAAAAAAAVRADQTGK